MKLSELWKEEMTKTLLMVYGGGLDHEKLSRYLDAKIAAVKPDELVLKLRSVYKGTVQEIRGNDILDVVEREKLIIGANGGYSENQVTNMSAVSKELIGMKKRRKIYKDEGLKTTDHDKQKFFDNLQTHVKQNTNAFYGIQLQPGSFLYNPDTASLITIQGQELISEMMWTFERLLEGNPQFYSMNECLLFQKRTLELPFNPAFESLITFIPNDEEFRKHFIDSFSSVPGFKDSMFANKISFYVFLKKLSKLDRIRLYYANNLAALLKRNPQVMKLIVDIVQSPEAFFTPLPQTPEEIARKEKPTLILNPTHKPNLKTLSDVVETYVYAPISNTQRIFRYVNRFRKSVVLSDTDSVMINIGNWSDRISEWSGLNIDDFADEERSFKVVNIMANLVTKISQLSAKNLCIRCRIPDEYHNLIEMKNEYLFKRLINYASTKKSYAAHIRMREGRVMDDLEWKGTKLVSSGLSPLVQELTHDMIENMILKSHTIDPIAILTKVKTLEETLRQRIREGDLTLGKSTRFSGEEYKNVYTNAGGRSCLSWNLIYPDDAIHDGEYGYMFDLTGISEKDCEGFKESDPEIYKRVKEAIFHNTKHPDLATYGIKYISIPKDGENRTVPMWLRPFLDVDAMINKHLQPIASLVPSIGVYRSRISSTKHTHSPLIRF